MAKPEREKAGLYVTLAEVVLMLDVLEMYRRTLQGNDLDTVTNAAVLQLQHNLIALSKKF